eukprot:Amastigsp_a515657_20.p6 type:complete len:111 gc:universal Amastigsp_a515657_20:667-999(+)
MACRAPVARARVPRLGPHQRARARQGRRLHDLGCGDRQRRHRLCQNVRERCLGHRSVRRERPRRRRRLCKRSPRSARRRPRRAGPACARVPQRQAPDAQGPCHNQAHGAL